jgi:hypothetical protein
MSYQPLQLAEQVAVHGTRVTTGSPPGGLRVLEEVGVLSVPGVNGQVIYRAPGSLFETRATVTPGGDFLLMFPTDSADHDPDEGHCHYGRAERKVNDLVAFRSSDGGDSWHGPRVAFDIDYNQHGFVPFIPRGGNRLYAFGTQPIWDRYRRDHGLRENAPIGYRWSDDDGHTWSDVRLIEPDNDPAFTGMSVMRMCETEAGSWLLGSHEADWSHQPLQTRQYILRSEDEGASWQLLPEARGCGWFADGFGRLDEGRPIHLGGGEVLLMVRSPEGHLWQARSMDDGRTWSYPEPTPLIHPDAPPMLFMLSDGSTLAAFHHNRHHDLDYTGLDGTKPELMADRSELWVALSGDGGRSWSEPRFLLANALEPSFDTPFRNHQCSYMDLFIDRGTIHMFIPHRWQQVTYLRFPETLLNDLPSAAMF